MITAVISSALTSRIQKASKLSQMASRAMSLLVESRARRAARELRRHEAFIDDLSRKQDHSSLFLDQSELLPVKI